MIVFRIWLFSLVFLSFSIYSQVIDSGMIGKNPRVGKWSFELGMGNVNLNTVDYYFNEYSDFILNTPVFVPIKIGSDTAIRSASFSYRFSENFALDFGFRSDILFLNDSNFALTAMLNGFTRSRGPYPVDFTDWTIALLSSRSAEGYFYTNNLFTGGKYFFSNTSKNWDFFTVFQIGLFNSFNKHLIIQPNLNQLPNVLIGRGSLYSLGLGARYHFFKRFYIDFSIRTEIHKLRKENNSDRSIIEVNKVDTLRGTAFELKLGFIF